MSKNPNRLTVEEVIEFNPTRDNPLIVECDDGFFAGCFRKIQIISKPIKSRVLVMDNDEELNTIEGVSLYHYPSQKQPPKTKTFYMWAIRRKKDGAWSVNYFLYDENLKDSNGDDFPNKERYDFKCLDHTAIELEVE